MKVSHNKRQIELIGQTVLMWNGTINLDIFVQPLSNSFCDVVMDSWVGKIERVNEELVIKFSDGASCRVPDTDLLEDFEPVKEHVSSKTEWGEPKNVISSSNNYSAVESFKFVGANFHGFCFFLWFVGMLHRGCLTFQFQ